MGILVYPKVFVLVFPVIILLWMESFIPKKVYQALYCYLGVSGLTFLVFLYLIQKLLNRDCLVALEKSNFSECIKWFESKFHLNCNRKLSVVEYQNEFEEIVNSLIKQALENLPDQITEENVSEDIKAVLKESIFNFVNSMFTMKKQRVLCKLVLILSSHYRNYVLCLKRISRKHGLGANFLAAQNLTSTIHKTFKYAHEGSKSACVEHSFLTNCSKTLLTRSLPHDLLNCEVICEILYNIVGKYIFGQGIQTLSEPKTMYSVMVNLFDKSLSRSSYVDRNKMNLNLLSSEDIKPKKAVHFDSLLKSTVENSTNLLNRNTQMEVLNEVLPEAVGAMANVSEKPNKAACEISPEYEDVGDFASAIEKLRQLLDEKAYKDENTKLAFQVSKSSPGSFDDCKPYKKKYSLGDRSESDSLLWLSSGDTFDCNDFDSGLSVFSNIRVSESDNSFDESPTESIYLIQFEAIFLDESQSSCLSVSDRQNILGSQLSPINHPNISTEVFNFASGLVQKSMEVKRKLPEFLMLQARLEKDSCVNKKLKDLFAPVKNEISLNKTGCEMKDALQNYLCKLSTISDIAMSTDFQKFMGYGFDSSSNYLVRSLDNSSLPRLDKLLAKKVSGVFHSIKTALPKFDIGEDNFSIPLHVTDVYCNEDDLKCRSSTSGQLYEQYKVEIQYYFKEEKKSALETLMDEYLAQFHVTCDSAFEVEEGFAMWQYESPQSYILKNRLQKQLLIRDDSQDSSSCDPKEYQDEDEIDGIDNQIPLLSNLINFIIELVRHKKSAIFQDPVVNAFKVLFGTTLERWLQKLTEQAISKENLLGISRAILKDNSNFNNTLSDVTPMDVQKLIIQWMPFSVVSVLGHESISEAVSLLVGVYQHPQLNRDVLFQCLQSFIEEMLMSES